VTNTTDQNPETPATALIEPVEPMAAEESGPEAAPPAPPVAPQPVQRRRGGVLPLLLGGFAAAALGAGATITLLPQLPARWQPASTLIAAGLAEQSARLAALQAELADVRAAISPAPDLAPLHAAISQAEARILEIEQRPVSAPADSAPAIEALRGELAALRAELAQSADGPQTTSAEIAAAAADASARIIAAETEAAAIRARAEAEAAALRAEAEAGAAKAVARSALAQLGAAVEAGAPVTDGLAALRAAGMTPPPELAADVPTLAALREGFAPAARAALGAARAAEPGAGTLDRLGSFLLAQTGARSLTAREGADADAVLSRAEAALSGGNLTEALAEIATLPDAARAEMARWQALAERRLAATRALADLAQSLN